MPERSLSPTFIFFGKVGLYAVKQESKVEKARSFGKKGDVFPTKRGEIQIFGPLRGA
jgi:hypothetical protein